jgi:histidinol-phosphatase (PHP family)
MEMSLLVGFIYDFCKKLKGVFHLIQHDRHVHTPFCPHGSKDTLSEYVEKALELGLTTISFTEHAPLPEGFIDTVPEKNSAMSPETLPLYLESCSEIKEYYLDRIKINIGLEVDFIQGYEKETTAFLNKWGPQLDDSILSVHFLKPDHSYICLDYGANAFEELLNKSGSLKNVYQLYYDTLLQSISCQLGTFTPKRIGHISLVRKFQKLFPKNFDDTFLLEQTLVALAHHHKTLDVNAAGLFKEHCQEVYPPISWLKKAVKMNIPLIYGSDAHFSKQLGQGRASLEEFF